MDWADCFEHISEYYGNEKTQHYYKNKKLKKKDINVLLFFFISFRFKKNKYLLHQNNREYIKTPEDLIDKLKIE